MTQLVCHLSDHGLLKVSGIDAKKLLQGQLTCQMEDIKPDQSSLAALCNPSGRVISLFYIFLLNDNYYLLMPRSMVLTTLAALKKYAIFYKVSLEDASDELMVIACAEENLHHPDTAYIKVSDERQLIVGPLTVMQALYHQLTLYINAVSTNTWKNLNISEGIPEIHPETSTKFLPHEINLPALNAVNFDKGCFTGQEIIARMEYRGKLKNKLYKAHVEHTLPPQPGNDIYFDQENGEAAVAGTIVDACAIEHDVYHLLFISDESHIQENHLFHDKKNKVYLSMETL